MNKTVLFTLQSLFFLLATIIAPSFVLAQSELSIPGQIPEVKEQISSTIEPPIPAPGQAVTITLEAYGTDLNRASIVWTNNGKEELKGTGEKVFTFTAASLGATNIIRAAITPANGPEIIKTFTISPAEIDLLWEASTYTPPFYRGKALFTPQADVTFVAIPNMISSGSRIASNQVIYKWKLDYRVEGDKSGFGKNTFKYTGPIILRPHVFQVEAYPSSNPKVLAKSTAVLEASNPMVGIYDDHPLYGVLFNRALRGSVRMSDAEKKVAAYPFFFSTSHKNGDLTYQWNINDSVIQAPESQNIMSFRKTANDRGTASVSVKVNSTKKFLQEGYGFVALFFNNAGGVFLRQ